HLRAIRKDLLTKAGKPERFGQRNGERSRLGCCSASPAPNSAPRGQTVRSGGLREWPTARAPLAAPEAGALPDSNWILLAEVRGKSIIGCISHGIKHHPDVRVIWPEVPGPKTLDRLPNHMAVAKKMMDPGKLGRARIAIHSRYLPVVIRP